MTVQQDAFAARTKYHWTKTYGGTGAPGQWGSCSSPALACTRRCGVGWVGPARGAGGPPSYLQLDPEVFVTEADPDDRAEHLSQRFLSRAWDPFLSPPPPTLPSNAAVKRGRVSAQNGVGGDHVLPHPVGLEPVPPTPGVP